MDDMAAQFEAKMERLRELDRRLRLLEAYVAVLEERKERAERRHRGEAPRPRLQLVQP